MSLLLLLGLSWSPAWTPTLQDQVTHNLSNLELAKDIKAYCPIYETLSKDQKVGFWSNLAIQIAGYESGYSPTQKTWEPSLGVYSVGLFQLSKEDSWAWCKENELTNPIENIKCAIPAMGLYIAQDQTIAVGNSLRTAKGLSRYWSTMWAGGRQGHLTEIKKALTEYCLFQKYGEL